MRLVSFPLVQSATGNVHRMGHLIVREAGIVHNMVNLAKSLDGSFDDLLGEVWCCHVRADGNGFGHQRL